MTSPADDHTRDDGMGPAPDGSAEHAALSMDNARCLFVLGLLRDGRPVEPALARAARAHAAADPALAARADELALVSDVVADLPALRASEGFTERVLAARRREAATPAQRVVSLPLRVAAAAALVLALVAVDEVRRPVETLADPSVEQQRFEADAFRNGPYAAPDLAAGLRALLPGPLDAERVLAAEVAAEAAAESGAAASQAGRSGTDATDTADEASAPHASRPDDGR